MPEIVNTENKRAVGVFVSRKQAEEALNELKNSGIPMDKISIIAKDADQGETVSNVEINSHIGSQDVNTAGAVGDAISASTWGSLLVGFGSLALPGIGAIIAAGSVGVALVSSLAGVAVSATATNNLVQALVSLGIPEERARFYSDRLQMGQYLIFLDGTGDEINQAESILKKRQIDYWGIYNAPSN